MFQVVHLVWHCGCVHAQNSNRAVHTVCVNFKYCLLLIFLRASNFARMLLRQYGQYAIGCFNFKFSRICIFYIGKYSVIPLVHALCMCTVLGSSRWRWFPVPVAQQAMRIMMMTLLSRSSVCFSVCFRMQQNVPQNT